MAIKQKLYAGVELIEKVIDLITRWFEDIGRVYFIIYEDVSNDQCLKHFHTNDKHYDER